MSSTFELKHNNDSEIIIEGSVMTTNLVQLKNTLYNLENLQSINALNLSKLKYADSNSFWMIRKWIKNQNSQMTIKNLPNHLKTLWDKIPIDPPSPVILDTQENIADQIHYKLNMIQYASQLGRQVFLEKNNLIGTQKQLLIMNFLSNVQEMGFKALPIFGLVSFFLGLVITFQGAYQLRLFDAELFTVDLLAISIFRELGPILTGIVLASRTGSAITAQIGTMNNNEEITMLEIMGLNPIKLVIMPKILAIIFISPFLTLFSCLMAMVGGLFIFTFNMGYSAQLFFSFFKIAITTSESLMFAWKGPLFASVIGLIACAQGMKVKQNAVDLSQKTTASVVAGLTSVLLIDGIIAILTTMRNSTHF